MSRNKSNSNFDFNRAVKKFFLSAFVVLAFIAYAIHERLTNSSALASSASAAPTSGASQGPSASSAGAPTTDPASSSSASNSSSQPVASNSGSSSASGYKNGTYTGPSVDVNYGLVEVQATIQNGKISDVQFLDYPHDRRTSQQINAIAMPDLQQEAIQAQSANVDIISGATLTSEGFQMSLQSALASAH
ncbi:MAG: FMN-binding protein [Anaerolineales bacterium]